jgi:hypothetical protein
MQTSVNRRIILKWKDRISIEEGPLDLNQDKTTSHKNRVIDQNIDQTNIIHFGSKVVRRLRSRKFEI